MAQHRFSNVRSFLANQQGVLAKGPVAMIFAEDSVEVASTVRHHLDCGFRRVLFFAPGHIELPEDVTGFVTVIGYDLTKADSYVENINAVIAAAPGIWLYYCFNAEYLFYPFCESRSVGELLTFHTEERRSAMLTYVVDLYASDLGTFPNAVSLEDAHLDRSGYYALGREDPETGHPRERQLDFYGGLRWRFEEHIPQERRKIDRISLFLSRPGLKLLPNHTFNEQEYNTYACPWHNNLTAAVVSFRTAKALKANPGSTFDIHNFRWHNSAPFEWHSRQLLDLGLMEPGQWF